jgi:predicted RNase H-like nuclease (RuvC/YqgF family)
MNPIQESKQELEASIRYAENAIAKAKQAIEQAATYQEQTGREQALEEQNNHLHKEVTRLENQNVELKSEGALLQERIDEMKDAAFASRKTIEHLKDKVQGEYDDIKQLERDLTVKTSQAEAWKKEYDKLKGEVEFYTKKYNELAQQKDVPTMPVIPKDVAIAIFREGMVYGASNVCDEIDNADSIMVEDSDHVGNFEVSFSMYVDLNDHLDLDFLRSAAVDNADEEWVVDCLNDLCADNKFECRIHGLDDTTIDLTKKND